jgi:hypothetical protein
MLTQNAQGKNSTVAAHPCPVGYYCIAGSVLPVACPIGTFAPNATVGALNDCTVCSEVSSVVAVYQKFRLNACLCMLSVAAVMHASAHGASFGLLLQVIALNVG